MDALTAAHDAVVQMIDTSVVRVHQHGACVADKQDRAVVHANGFPEQLGLTPAGTHDNQLCTELLMGL
jgi:hypothetical protein